ncbi:hypothetical protein MAMT_01680 [Methylacidimicrobium tartarophylax]|uniref:Uncharacterized protein n=2 Tax=Methylacidimicrobium tartarophylax TaxID=1041768 RepID=A0A5E6MD10_9BACT|nr:hypothetical protein MAMT_01680 [Methylacidimicrobium tartarophylax]
METALRMANKAFRGRYRAAFWRFPDSFVATEKNLPVFLCVLREWGGRDTWFLAAEIEREAGLDAHRRISEGNIRSAQGA